MRRLSTIFGVVLLALAGVGCKQGLGGRCETSGDCSSGLCSVATGGASTPGVCRDPNAPIADAGSVATDAAGDGEAGATPDLDGSSAGETADAAEGDGGGGDAPADAGPEAASALDGAADVGLDAPAGQ